MAVWAAILILRPNQSDAKRWVLFMIGTSLALTAAANYEKRAAEIEAERATVAQAAE